MFALAFCLVHFALDMQVILWYYYVVIMMVMTKGRKGAALTEKRPGTPSVLRLTISFRMISLQHLRRKSHRIIFLRKNPGGVGQGLIDSLIDRELV